MLETIRKQSFKNCILHMLRVHSYAVSYIPCIFHIQGIFHMHFMLHFPYHILLIEVYQFFTILGCSPRPRKRPAGSTRKFPFFSVCESRITAIYAYIYIRVCICISYIYIYIYIYTYIYIHAYIHTHTHTHTHTCIYVYMYNEEKNTKVSILNAAVCVFVTHVRIQNHSRQTKEGGRKMEHGMCENQNHTSSCIL
jgi:hypothetical protein